MWLALMQVRVWVGMLGCYVKQSHTWKAHLMVDDNYEDCYCVRCLRLPDEVGL